MTCCVCLASSGRRSLPREFKFNTRASCDNSHLHAARVHAILLFKRLTSAATNISYQREPLSIRRWQRRNVCFHHADVCLQAANPKSGHTSRVFKCNVEKRASFQASHFTQVDFQEANNLRKVLQFRLPNVNNREKHNDRVHAGGNQPATSNGFTRKLNKKVAVSASRAMTCCVCLHLQEAVCFRATFGSKRG